MSLSGVFEEISRTKINSNVGGWNRYHNGFAMFRDDLKIRNKIGEELE